MRHLVVSKARGGILPLHSIYIYNSAVTRLGPRTIPRVARKRETSDDICTVDASRIRNSPMKARESIDQRCIRPLKINKLPNCRAAMTLYLHLPDMTSPYAHIDAGSRLFLWNAPSVRACCLWVTSLQCRHLQSRVSLHAACRRSGSFRQSSLQGKRHPAVCHPDEPHASGVLRFPGHIRVYSA